MKHRYSVVAKQQHPSHTAPPQSHDYAEQLEKRKNPYLRHLAPCSDKAIFKQKINEVHVYNSAKNR